MCYEKKVKLNYSSMCCIAFLPCTVKRFLTFILILPSSDTKLGKAMPNRTSVKRPRARRFKSPQSNKKNTNFVGEIFVNNFDVPGFRKITIFKLKI